MAPIKSTLLVALSLLAASAAWAQQPSAVDPDRREDRREIRDGRQEVRGDRRDVREGRRDFRSEHGNRPARPARH